MSRIPFLIIDAVQDPHYSIFAFSQRSLHPHPQWRIADFARIGWAYGADPIGILDAGFQGIDGVAGDVALIEQRPVRAQSKIRRGRARHDALIAYVMYCQE